MKHLNNPCNKYLWKVSQDVQ